METFAVKELACEGNVCSGAFPICGEVPKTNMYFYIFIVILVIIIQSNTPFTRLQGNKNKRCVRLNNSY
jgi:hypothetical protein